MLTDKTGGPGIEMGATPRPKIGLACIARFVDSADHYREFLKNARNNAHQIDFLVLAISRLADAAVIAELSELVRVEPIIVGQDELLTSDLLAAGARADDVSLLLDWELLDDYGLVPYEVPRNAATLRAILLGVDFLVFFDRNMRPAELVGDPLGPDGMRLRQVDFVGAHVSSLAEGFPVTTGGYSGFDAFPPVSLDALRDLLHGLGREESFDIIAKEEEDAGLHIAPDPRPAPRPTLQTWGGNLGLDLREASRLPAFYSGWYRMGEQVVLARGEDTLFGAAAMGLGLGCRDVGTRVFLDPHDTFPVRPALDQPRLRNRLYWNCLGWVARLPLLDQVRHDSGLLDWSLDDLRASRRLGLQTGASELAEVLEDYRFLDLPTFFDLAHMRLERTLELYRAVQGAWRRTVRAIAGG